MAQHTGNFLFLIYLGYFFPSFPGGDGPPEGLRRWDHFYIGQFFAWYNNTSLIHISSRLDPQKSRGGLCRMVLYTNCFDRFECWFLISCIFRARLGSHPSKIMHYFASELKMRRMRKQWNKFDFACALEGNS